MGLFRKKRCKKRQDFIFNVEAVFKHPEIILLRVDIFPNQTAIIELHNSEGEVYNLSVDDIKRIQ